MKINTSEFDDKFDKGEDVSEYLVLSRAKRGAHPETSIVLELPSWILDSLDREATRMGTTRGAIIKIWLAERLEAASANDEEQSEGR